MPERGCGSREQGCLYAVIPTSFCGYSIEHFLVDPTTVWTGPQLRSPMLAPSAGVNHIFLGVGKEAYPFVPDFVEEAKVMGVSKKIPFEFDLNQLTPGKSKLLLVHPRAIAAFRFKIPKPWCPWERCEYGDMQGTYPCQLHRGEAKEAHAPEIGDLWALSALQGVGNKHEVTEYGSKAGAVTATESARVKTPSCQYEVSWPQDFPKDKKERPDKSMLIYKPGVFLRFGSFLMEFVNKKGKLPKDLEKRAKDAGWNVEVMPE